VSLRDGKDPILDGVVDALRHGGHSAPAVLSYVLIAEFLNDEGERCIFHDVMEDQRGLTTLGLLDYAHTVERRRMADEFMETE
jgi:hypothetical protein